jgi:hypothetical protein
MRAGFGWRTPSIPMIVDSRVPAMEPVVRAGVGVGSTAGGPSPPAMPKGNSKMLISALVTFLVVILILYLINMLPIDGRAKQIARIVVIILGVISLLKYIAVF